METLERIAQRLGGLRHTIRTLFVIDWLGRTLLFVSVFAIALFLTDFLLLLPLQLRVLTELAALSFAGYVAYTRLIRPLALPISDDDLALLVEREYPHLKDRLISAIQLGRAREENPKFNSPELIDKLVTETTAEAQGLEFNRIVTPRFVVRPLLIAGALMLLIAGSAVAYPDYAGIFLKRLVSDAKWPAETDLEVLDFDAVTHKKVVARGDQLMIVCQAKRKRPSKVYFNYEYTKPREKGSESMKMLPPQDQNKFFFDVNQVIAGFKFYISSRDVETEWYTVDVLDPPELKDPQVFFTYPSYLQMAPTPADFPETNPNIKAPMYTQVKFVSACEQDLEEAELWLGKRGQEKMTKLAVKNDKDNRPRVVEAAFPVDSENSEYSIRIKGKSGLWNRDPLRYSIKGVPDQKPTIQVVRPRASVEEVTKDCVKTIALACEDDHGIKEIRMLYRVISENKPTDWFRKVYTEKELFPPTYGEKKLKVTDLLEMAMLAVKEKDVVELKFVIEDFKDIGDKNIYETKPFQLRVVSTAEKEEKLEHEIEKLKADLKKLLSRQSQLQGRTDFLKNKYLQKPTLTGEEQGEIRAVSIDQNEITNKLEAVWKELELIMESGRENRIFDERSADALKKAVDILKELTTTATNPPGPSYDAAQKLLNAAKAKSQTTRDQSFLDARRLQGENYDGISRALDALDKWATFQEAVRIARLAYEAEKETKRAIEERQRCKNCKLGNCPIHK
jgi:hypothetical protein